jgi:dTDP-4-amino-4,6-dideoxygalactose transaminase
MDTIQAAVLLEKLKIFDNEIKKRNLIADSYIKFLKDFYEIQLIPNDCSSAYAQFSFLTTDRSFLMNELKKKSIPTNIYYATPLHKQKSMNIDVRLPICEFISNNIISIPVHPYLTKYEVSYIINELRGISCTMNEG